MVREDVERTIAKVSAEMDSFELETMLSGKYDQASCILSIQSGAGGTEAQDWAGMLFRMYKRYAERRGFGFRVIGESPADFGIKSAEIEITGPYAFGCLSAEKGAHRLVRVSPFNAQGKRQTSFVAVELTPILDDSSLKYVFVQTA